MTTQQQIYFDSVVLCSELKRRVWRDFMARMEDDCTLKYVLPSDSQDYLDAFRKLDSICEYLKLQYWATHSREIK